MKLIERKRVIVESVPLENNSKKTVTAHCGFSLTNTKSELFSSSVTAEIKQDIPLVAEVKFSGTFMRSITQTAAQATQAGGDVTLAPGEHLTCNRTYGYTRFSVHSWDNFGTDTGHNQRWFKVRVPSRLGILFTD